MALPVFFIDPAARAEPGSIIIVDGSEGHHAAQVTRLRTGEGVELVDGEGRRITGRVEAVAKDRIDVAVLGVEVEESPEPRIVVVQAIPKGDRAERAVEAMTEVGVDVIVPWSAAHCIVRWTPDRAAKGVTKWRQVARSAAKQSRRARVPEISDVHTVGDLAPWTDGASAVLLLDETSTLPLASCDIPQGGDVVLVVGPEGGLADREREDFVAAGAVPVHLGPTILRTSTAGAVAAAVVASRTARWGAGSVAPSQVPG